jgi:hypothetical protein
MRFTSKCKIAAGRTEQLEFPNMTKNTLVPMHVSIFDSTTQSEPAKEIICRVLTGNTEIGCYTEPYFVKTHTMALEDNKSVILRGGDLALALTNKSREVKQYTIYVDYEKSFGAIIYQQKTDKFDRILKDIRAVGICTRLEISFNRKIKELQLRTLTECDAKEWITPLVITVDEEDPVYTVDFSTDDFLVFAENLNFLQFMVAELPGDHEEPLQMYVLAYGFATKK